MTGEPAFYRFLRKAGETNHLTQDRASTEFIKNQLDLPGTIVNKYLRMRIYSSIGAAKKLGVSPAVITKYIKAGKIPVPKMTEGAHRYIWTEAEVEYVRQLLPKIANGRKTRYKKKHSAVGTQQSAKAKTKSRSKSKK